MELFIKYGGLPFWSRFLDHFYEKAMKDSMLRFIFVGRDMKCIKEMQLSLLALTLTCGHYSDASIEEVHERLNLTQALFSRFTGLYERALEDLGVQREDVEFMVAILESYRSQVLGDD